jgi:hypothetical protein
MLVTSSLVGHHGADMRHFFGSSWFFYAGETPA